MSNNLANEGIFQVNDVEATVDGVESRLMLIMTVYSSSLETMTLVLRKV